MARKSPSTANRFQEIAISSIVEMPFKLRERHDLEKLGELGSSIAENGLLHPVVVRPKGAKFQLIAGGRRLKVSKLTNVKFIPACVVGEDIDDRRAIIMALVENLQRHDLEPFEDAMVFLKLIKDFEMSTKEIASQVGCSESLVRKRLKLLSLPEEIQKMIVQKKVPLSHVDPIASAGSREEQGRLTKTARRHNLSQRDLVTMIHEDGGRKVRPRRGKPMDSKRVELKVRDFTRFMQQSIPPVLEGGGPGLRSMRSALKRLSKDLRKYLLAIREET